MFKLNGQLSQNLIKTLSFSISETPLIRLWRIMCLNRPKRPGCHTCNLASKSTPALLTSQNLKIGIISVRINIRPCVVHEFWVPKIMFNLNGQLSQNLIKTLSFSISETALIRLWRIMSLNRPKRPVCHMCNLASKSTPALLTSQNLKIGTISVRIIIRPCVVHEFWVPNIMFKLNGHLSQNLIKTLSFSISETALIRLWRIMSLNRPKRPVCHTCNLASKSTPALLTSQNLKIATI